MMKVKRLVAVAAAVAMVAAIALPAMAAKPVSVGRFVQELAKAKSLNATDPEIAVESLTAVGVRLPADLDLNKRLVEADVARISRLAGLRVSTSNPTEPFDEDEVERFFLSFSSELGSGGDEGASPNEDGNGNGLTFNPYTKGKGGSKGKKKGHGGPLSPSEPE